MVATKLVHNAKLQTSNYWSLLACLVKEQDEHAQENHTKVEKAMLAIADGQPTNKKAAHFSQKLSNRKLQRYAFLDSGATSGAAPEEDEQDLNSTGESSRKAFMFPNRCTGKATKKMLLKHNLQLATQETNIMPVPKLADAG
jgi:hypothetical protein